MMLAAAARPATRSACPGAEAGPDGLCVHCGRRARYEEQFDRQVHVRGRVAGVSPYRLPERPATVFARPIRCPDCDAPVQVTGGGRRRCPWATAARQRGVDGLTACDWPYRDMTGRS